MKNLLSTGYADWAFNVAMLLLRLAAGVLLMMHGYDHLVHFSTYRLSFMNFLGIGSTNSLLLVIFAELFCSFFVVIGLFTRFAAIPPVIAMGVALMKAHHGDFFGKGQAPTLFLVAFLAILLCGPGKASVDGLMGK